jgi:peptidoglycan hydrolase-like protein with peptidoglycan-binding domain
MKAVALKVVELPKIKRGSSGDSVLLVKKILKGLGYGGMNLKSKKFGSGTEKAVRAWQADTPLVATTGVISNDDWARLL